ncbi:(2Fe-2S) ferredoxin domain-containing protein [Aquisalimonas lutea]|uniref:(2Fe-2S) ferredoxin domain-containing protein n=1 Tax=Aquisalimonas lutea TaxID=1327750 RepID=UPI0025B33633|nr:(2Fe-2S) ferredoxin domain-containing protein [Aquisalimonas lutea]MDN3516136.1 (2Fe-2S) ferredoxin domain-containing protein [Aquisalimonas lutea]
MGYYRRHVFVCTNQRDGGRTCCAATGGDDAGAYLKDRMRALGLRGRGGVRVSTAGCLGRCGDGPVLVVYPEAIWYTFRSHQDLDEIVERHLCGGDPVARLQLADQ